jgi:sugar phosphate isomerase/epimerase
VLRGDRREFLIRSGFLGVAALTAINRVDAYAPPAPLGFMLHALRASALEDLPGTLVTMAMLGYQEVELISFRGFSGPGSREGFDALAAVSPLELRAMVQDAGLNARSAHVRFWELDDTNSDATLEWASALGIEYITLADFAAAGSSADWSRQFEWLSSIGSRVVQSGLKLGIHTPNELWHRFDGISMMERFLTTVDAKFCGIQLDLSTAQNNGVDSAHFLRSTPGRVYGVHLRDADTPPRPVTYLNALPLGEGDLDWPELFAAARDAHIEMYVVEMQSRGATDPIEAYRRSIEFIRELSEIPSVVRG